MTRSSTRFSRGSLFLAAIGVLGFVALALAILIPRMIRPKNYGQLTACKSNLKNIGTGLEMYSTDYGGRYPTSLAQLTPNYLKTLPQCPTAGRDTYSASYVRSTVSDQPSVRYRTHGTDGPCANDGRRLLKEASNFRQRQRRWPSSIAEMKLDPKLRKCPYSGEALDYTETQQTYLVSCAGTNHQSYGLPADRPAYSSTVGLIER